VRGRGGGDRGKRSGVWEFWYEDGSRWTRTEHARGQRHGRHLEWTADGEVITDELYEAGELVAPAAAP